MGLICTKSMWPWYILIWAQLSSDQCNSGSCFIAMLETGTLQKEPCHCRCARSFLNNFINEIGRHQPPSTCTKCLPFMNITIAYTELWWSLAEFSLNHRSVIKSSTKWITPPFMMVSYDIMNGCVVRFHMYAAKCLQKFTCSCCHGLLLLRVQNKAFVCHRICNAPATC